MKNIIPHYIIVFGIGAFGHGGIEILYRGHTHPTMLFAGGIALLSLFEISKHNIPLSIKAILGGGIITAVEFSFGCVFNLGLGMKIWDYSDKPYNIFGQVCPSFFFTWVLLSFLGIFLCKKISKLLSMNNTDSSF